LWVWGLPPAHARREVSDSVLAQVELHQRAEPCRGTSLIRKRNPIDPYRRPVPRVL
jgi:hypothetical protein